MNEHDELKLVFITKKGVDYDNLNLYQLFFSLNHNDVVGDEWDCTPALNQPKIPEEEYLDAVFEIKTELLFDLATESRVYSMDDCIDGVIALGWENIDDYEVYPSPRIVLHYGESLTSLKEKLGHDNLTEVKINKRDEE